MAIQYSAPAKQNLKSVVIFDARSNSKTPAILDLDTNLVIGFSSVGPYYPAGGFGATEEIASSECGLVPGCDLWGFECDHLHDDVYRLASSVH